MGFCDISPVKLRDLLLLVENYHFVWSYNDVNFSPISWKLWRVYIQEQIIYIWIFFFGGGEGSHLP